METVYWVATLGDGTTAVEHKGDWTVIPGERLPWVRLCNHLGKQKLRLTSLRLRVGDRTIHMPKLDERWGYKTLAPEYYSLQYHAEVIDIFNGGGEQFRFVDIGAHYDTQGIVVHYIQDLGDENNAWVAVTDPYMPLAPTPMVR